MKKVIYVKKLTDKSHYPTHDKNYLLAHRAANAAEKKLDPKMYLAENRAERKIKPHELMATHTKKDKIEIEKKFKPFAKTLVRHETTEFKKDPGRKGAKY